MLRSHPNGALMSENPKDAARVLGLQREPRALDLLAEAAGDPR